MTPPFIFYIYYIIFLFCGKQIGIICVESWVIFVENLITRNQKFKTMRRKYPHAVFFVRMNGEVVPADEFDFRLLEGEDADELCDGLVLTRVCKFEDSYFLEEEYEDFYSQLLENPTYSQMIRYHDYGYYEPPEYDDSELEHYFNSETKCTRAIVLDIY